MSIELDGDLKDIAEAVDPSYMGIEDQRAELQDTVENALEGIKDLEEPGASSKKVVRRRAKKIDGGFALSAAVPLAMTAAKFVTPLVKKMIAAVHAKIAKRGSGISQSGDYRGLSKILKKASKMAKRIAKDIDDQLMRDLESRRISGGASFWSKVKAGVSKAAKVAAKVAKEAAPAVSAIYDAVGKDLLDKYVPGASDVIQGVTDTVGAYKEGDLAGALTKGLSTGKVLYDTAKNVSGRGVPEQLMKYALDKDSSNDVPFVNSIREYGGLYPLMATKLSRMASRMSKVQGGAAVGNQLSALAQRYSKIAGRKYPTKIRKSTLKSCSGGRVLTKFGKSYFRMNPRKGAGFMDRLRRGAKYARKAIRIGKEAGLINPNIDENNLGDAAIQAASWAVQKAMDYRSGVPFGNQYKQNPVNTGGRVVVNPRSRYEYMDFIEDSPDFEYMRQRDREPMYPMLGGSAYPISGGYCGGYARTGSGYGTPYGGVAMPWNVTPKNARMQALMYA